MTNTLISRAKKVAFQGEAGAYANLAAREALSHAMAIPSPTFEDAIAAVRERSADLCIIPFENSLHGRIADIHHLLPQAGLYIVGEHFHRVRHQLLGMKGATLAGLKMVFSQAPALHREAALALGATRWEMIRMAVLPYGKSGVIGGAMLGLGRALGEPD